MSWWTLTAATRSAGVLRGTMRNFLQIWFLLRARQPSFGRAKKKRNRIVCYPNLTSRFPCNGNKTKGKNGKRKAPPWNDGLESWRLCLKVFPCSWSVSSLLKRLSVRLSCYKSSLFFPFLAASISTAFCTGDFYLWFKRFRCDRRSSNFSLIIFRFCHQLKPFNSKIQVPSLRLVTDWMKKLNWFGGKSWL